MMFRQNARSFPVDIIEAARIDGLSEVRIFFQMFIPTMKSTYAAAAVITFMNAWKDKTNCCIQKSCFGEHLE